MLVPRRALSLLRACLTPLSPYDASRVPALDARDVGSRVDVGSCSGSSDGPLACCARRRCAQLAALDPVEDAACARFVQLPPVRGRFGKTGVVHVLLCTPTGSAADATPGDSRSGKSTLVSHLGSSSSTPVASTSTAAVNLGLGFSYVDVRDDAEEGAPSRSTGADCAETLARLGVYELGTASPSHAGLLPLTLGADATAQLADAFALIVLDWSRPWQFLDALRRWLGVLQRVTRSAAALEDGRDRGPFAPRSTWLKLQSRRPGGRTSSIRQSREITRTSTSRLRRYRPAC